MHDATLADKDAISKVVNVVAVVVVGVHLTLVFSQFLAVQNSITTAMRTKKCRYSY